MPMEISAWLDGFTLDHTLRPHIAEVFTALPEAVRGDLMNDPAFRLVDYETGGQFFLVPVGIPSARGGARSVVLKRSLGRRPSAFIRYIIAHELAHAHLRNAGRSPGEDPELAADALAEHWGFPRPPAR